MGSRKHVLDGGEDALLPTARQLADFFEDASSLAGRSAARQTARRADHQFVSSRAEDFREFCRLIRSQCDIATFPKGIRALKDAELFRYLLLRQPGGLAQRLEARAEFRTRRV